MGELASADRCDGQREGKGEEGAERLRATGAGAQRPDRHLGQSLLRTADVSTQDCFPGSKKHVDPATRGGGPHPESQPVKGSVGKDRGLLGEGDIVGLSSHLSVPAHAPWLSVEGASTLGLLVVDFTLVLPGACL